MKASYTKESDYYVLSLDCLKFRIPFRYCIGGCVSMDITDDIMDLIVYKYNRDCLELSYNGEKVTKDMVNGIFENENIKITDLKLRVKE